MINVTGIDHVVFRVRDLEAMIRFYADVLGVHEERRMDEAGLVQLRAGNALIDLLKVGADEALTGSQANVDHLCLRISPWDDSKIVRHLAIHGIADVEIASRYGAEGQGPSIYIHDPEGNMIELKGPPWPVGR